MPRYGLSSPVICAEPDDQGARTRTADAGEAPLLIGDPELARSQVLSRRVARPFVAYRNQGASLAIWAVGGG